MTKDQSVKSNSLSSTSEPIREIEILWITAATQPSLEDILLGALHGIPKINLHLSGEVYLSDRMANKMLQQFVGAGRTGLK
jgi:hypothetical protein